MQRRDFLKSATATSLGLFILPGMACNTLSTSTRAYGLGIYSVREALEKDFAGTLKKLADLGFKDLELWNYNQGKLFGFTAKEIKAMLDDNGLTASSLHVGIDPLTKDLDNVLAFANDLDQQYIACNWLAPNERETLDQYKGYVDLFNKCGEQTAKINIQFCYHNHEFEFFDFDGQRPYDLLLEGCDKNLVHFEMDMYWMTFAQEDPIAYFKQYPGRFPLWHVKDMNNEKQFTPIGEGIINWEELFKNAELAGLKQYFIEQDASPNGDILADITKSIGFVKEKGY